MKKLLLFLTFYLPATIVFSQDSELKKLFSALQMKQYPADTTAEAVVLEEFGDSRISSIDNLPLIHKYKTRIKIFTSKGFRHGDVVIPIYKRDNNSYETVAEIKAITYNLDENGSLEKTELAPKKIYRENKNKYWDLVKFAMPNLREGCVIEYSYELTSPYKFNFRTWTFQSDIPKIASEYVAHIPAIYNYNVSLKGFLQLKEAPLAELEKECFNAGGGYKSDCSKITYRMAHIPALVEEDYMTAAVNFRSAINFELSEYADYRGAVHKITKDWKDIDYELKKDDRFGSQLRKKDLFKDKIPGITAGLTDDEKARVIYRYIQNWFKWNNVYGLYSENGLKKALDTRSGNVGDINISLIAAMNAAGLKADAVLVSTRENGIVNKLYPVVSDFNYVVAKVNIGDKHYLLDATDPLLPFGLLPLRCINDQGRVFSMDKPSYWMDLSASEKGSKLHTLQLTLTEGGKIRGNLITIYKGYEAYNKRRAVKKFNSVEEYIENLDENMPKIRFLKAEIKNLDEVDLPVSETFELEIDAFDSLEKEKFTFNPYFMDRTEVNPFKLRDRVYPVDLGSASETKVILTLNFPDKFEVIGKPETVGLALPQNGGRFITDFNISGNTINFSQLTDLKKSVYMQNEYPYLKELFNKMVQVHQTDIIFRKK